MSKVSRLVLYQKMAITKGVPRQRVPLTIKGVAMKHILLWLNVALIFIVVLMYMHGMSNLFEPITNALTPK